ncbi:WD40 repeat-like protein [Rhizoctonia solani]|uniref:WD40 repeat-like protein n=1 Tax=Rhizoctonia solani TaxID=456999 RepID=A0A8H7I1E0_9AGAM|nr:WD40 repeat-like protein [Rhizoctonia solani]
MAIKKTWLRVFTRPRTSTSPVRNDPWNELGARLEKLSGMLGACAPLKAIIDELAECFKARRQSTPQDQQEYEDLRTQLEGIVKDLQDNFSSISDPIASKSLDKTCESLQQELNRISEIQAKTSTGRYREAEFNRESLLASCRRIQTNLQLLSTMSSLVTRMSAEEDTKEDRIKNLNPSHSAYYNSYEATKLERRGCTSGTRATVLSCILGWAYEPSTEPVFWMNGMAGTGKTTIAYSVCQALDQQGGLSTPLQPASSAQTSCLNVEIRPEPVIREQISKQPGGLVWRMILHELDHQELRDDIKTYLASELASLNLSDSELKSLTRRAGVLFIYAATVVRYVSYSDFGCNSRDRLKDVMNQETSAVGEIDELYSTILQAALNKRGLRDKDKQDIIQVLHTVICSRAPLTIDALSGLLKMNNTSRVHAALRSLWSVLHITGPSESVNILHKSFHDYMIDSKRAGNYHCQETTHHGVLVRLCFDCIEAAPPFNICQLETSYILDKGVKDMQDRVSTRISLQLRYSCQFWMSHLGATLGASNEQLGERIQKFLSTRLLLWLEVMNLSQLSSAAVECAYGAKEWSMRYGATEDLRYLANDAWRFTTAFACHPPTDNSTRFKAHNQQVHSIAFSSNGTRLVSGSKDATMSVWDTQSWSRVLGPIKGHSRGIETVIFSPDDKLIISGSNDKTIRIWDAQSGQPILDPLAGHSNFITSVAISSSGNLIASGSGDESIRVWNAQSRDQVLKPLVHRSYVTSVIFSSDEATLYCGAVDSTIKAWDIKTGNMVLHRPFTGHTGAIRCIAVSSHGSRETYVASGSDDCTIRVWDPTTGETSFGPFRNHSHLVRSVAFSHDNTRVVSGSKDGFVCLWDLQTARRTQTLTALPGHTKQIKSLDISPDGTRLLSGAADQTTLFRFLSLPDGEHFVSGSHDETIRIWEARTGQHVFGPFKWHTDWVNSVAYSPNGYTIVSGSKDKTLRLWDAKKGKMILGPLEGHEKPILTVKFFPDSKRVISGSADDVVRVWDAEKGEILHVIGGCIKRIDTVAFSPDCTQVVSGSFDKVLRIRDALTGHLIPGSPEMHVRNITSIHFLVNGTHMVSGSDDKTICVWDARSGEPITGLLRGHTDSIRSVFYLPNGCKSTNTLPHNDWVLGKDGWVQQETDHEGKPQLRRLVWVSSGPANRLDEARGFGAVLSRWVS